MPSFLLISFKSRTLSKAISATHVTLLQGCQCGSRSTPAPCEKAQASECNTQAVGLYCHVALCLYLRSMKKRKHLNENYNRASAQCAMWLQHTEHVGTKSGVAMWLPHMHVANHKIWPEFSLMPSIQSALVRGDIASDHQFPNY